MENVEKEILKWKPVLSKLKINEKYYEFFVKYIHHYIDIESKQIGTKIHFSSNDLERNLLPINLKVLSMINMDKVNVEIISPEELTDNMMIDVTNITSKSGIEDLKFSINIKVEGIESVEAYESILMHMLADYINGNITDLKIYQLVSKIYIETDEKSKLPVAVLISRISKN